MNGKPVIAVLAVIEVLAHIEFFRITKLLIEKEVGDSFYVVTQHTESPRD